MTLAALSLLSVALFQTTGGGDGYLPLPPRAYQPKLVDPGLHGGRPKFQSDQDGHPGDVTPDGKVLVFYRKAWDPTPGEFRSALQVAAFDPDYVQASSGHLEGFYEPGSSGTVIGGETMWGSDYAITPITDREDAVPDDAFLLHFSPPTLPGHDPTCPECPTLNRDYLPMGPSATLTLALKPLAGHAGGGANPYPSNANGGYDPNGTFRTYQLWMVTTHSAVDPENISEDVPATWQCENRRWVFRGGPMHDPILGSRDVTVIVDVSSHPHRVHAASAGDFTPLTLVVIPGQPIGEHIIGTEPSITADGRLLVFNGDGGTGGASMGKVTYVHNPDPCDPHGWRNPRSITALHELAHTTNPVLLRYPLSWFPIQGPDASGTAYHTYTSADLLNGTYPWIDKDGAFFLSAHTFSWEGRVILDNPATTTVNEQADLRAQRSSIVACGAITGGYIKHVDDVAVNPTRQGGNFDWPWTGDSAHDAQRDSQMTTFFSTGLKPSLWEPFFDEGVPVPTMPATRRIPVLPLWIHRTRLYGEARFEEADGNYLLYLACNEAFKKNGNPEHPSQVDPVRTADTSGRSSRAICNLLDGASFAQEAWGDPDEDDPIIKYQNGQPVPRMNAQALRLEMWPGPETSLQYHENIGFKGRAIVFPTAGYVQVTGGPLYAGPSSPYGASGSVVTFQAFVKPMRSWAAQQLTILKDTGHFALKLKTNGQFRAEVTVRHGGTLKTKVVESRLDAVTSESDEFDPTAGWRHVAVTFDGNDANGKSVLWMYLDGQPEDSTVWTGESHFEGPATDVSVGPRINGGVTNPQSAVLVLDEVAISDVLRTDDEIRRDACVAPWPTGFQHVWPPMADVTIPQEWVARVSWPNGVTYSAAKVALGRDLFFDPILSEPGSRLDSDPTSPISCALCHEPQHGFAEAQALAGSSNPAVQALFNTPTVLNSAFGRHKMFNGRAASLEDQVVLPLTSGKEMGSQSIAQVIGRLNGASSPYGARFTGIYGGGATANRLAEVLAMYQRTLVSKDAPFDAAPGFPAFTAEQRGRALFFGKARCFGCHRGPAFTDDDFHNIQTVTQSSLMDLGKATGRGTDDGKLKTPTLRNIAKTGPYFHDGSRATLAEVIDHYDGGFLSVPGAIGVPDLDLLPIELTAGEESDLEQFLLSLSGTDPN